MHFMEEHCLGCALAQLCVTVQMNVFLLLLIKHSLLDFRDKTSLYERISSWTRYCSFTH